MIGSIYQSTTNYCTQCTFWTIY